MPVVTPDLLNRIPKLTLPDGRVVSLLHEDLTSVKLPVRLQRRAIQRLTLYLQEVRALPDDTITDGGATKHGIIDTVSWQLAKFMRYSSPTRIAEAVPALDYVTESYKNLHNGQITVIPTLYLAVALSRIDGEEERATTAFTEGLDNLYGGPQVPALNLIWARANFARMLRRMNRLEDAGEQERLTREWILKNVFNFKPSAITEALSDDLGSGDNILSHPDIVRHFATIIELDPQHMIVGNVLVFYGGPTS